MEKKLTACQKFTSNPVVAVSSFLFFVYPRPLPPPARVLLLWSPIVYGHHLPLRWRYLDSGYGGAKSVSNHR